MLPSTGESHELHDDRTDGHSKSMVKLPLFDTTTTRIILVIDHRLGTGLVPSQRETVIG